MGDNAENCCARTPQSEANPDFGKGTVGGDFLLEMRDGCNFGSQYFMDVRNMIKGLDETLVIKFDRGCEVFASSCFSIANVDPGAYFMLAASHRCGDSCGMVLLRGANKVECNMMWNSFKGSETTFGAISLTYSKLAGAVVGESTDFANPKCDSVADWAQGGHTDCHLVSVTGQLQIIGVASSPSDAKGTCNTCNSDAVSCESPLTTGALIGLIVGPVMGCCCCTALIIALVVHLTQKNRTQKKGNTSTNVAVATPAAVVVEMKTEDKTMGTQEERLAKIKSMFEKGMLTEAEYDEKRKNILSTL